jgi:hypothetical protein
MWRLGDYVQHMPDGITGSIQGWAKLDGRTCSRKAAMAAYLGCVMVAAGGAGEPVRWAIRDCRQVPAPMFRRN